MKQNILLSMFLLNSFFQYAHSQVTIGASIPPAKGAILDLSPYPTMNKGMMLPRVALSDLNRLIIGGKLVSDNADNEDIKIAHTGLVVYNVNEEICADEPIYASIIYVWSGEKWEGMNAEQSKKWAPTVQLLIDDRDPNNVEHYMTGVFGNKRWMLENLRAKKWDPKRDDPSEKQKRMNTLLGPCIVTEGKAAWAYPKERNSQDASDAETNNDRWFRERPELGLLYNFDAASNYKYTDYKTAGPYPQEGGGSFSNEKHVQGICPSGWHLPTDKEWTDLEIELIQNTPKYAYIDKALSSDKRDLNGLTYGNDNSQRMRTKLINGKHEHGRGTLHGKVMRGRCESAKGLSRGANKNGFVLTLAGHVYAAQRDKANFYGIDGQAFLWTSSHDQGGFWGRGLYDAATTFVRSSFDKNYMFSVRCVQN